MAVILKIHLSAFILVACLSISLKGQDSIISSNIELIIDQLENIAESNDSYVDYSDLLETYINLSANPIDINGENLRLLVDKYIINEAQYWNLIEYKRKYGALMSIFELLSIDGFDRESVKRIEPFICFNKKNERNKISLKEIFNYGKHITLLRSSRLLELKQGFKTSIDSAIYKPGSAFIGDPYSIYLRHNSNFNNRLRFGITLEKDAGEALSLSLLPDSVRSAFGNKNYLLSDFFSAHLCFEDFGFIKKIIIGDFHVEAGQGLTLWSGLTFGKSLATLNIQRYPRGITPNTSTNENRYFRGIAAKLSFWKMDIIAFYSNNNIDAGYSLSDSNQLISSLKETGYHRTINELKDRKSVNMVSIGANLVYSAKRFKVGITGVDSRLNLSLAPSKNVYKHFAFTGKNIMNLGIDFSYSLKAVNLYGELSHSSNNGIAAILGINSYINDRFYLTVVYHNYSKNYYGFYINPYSAGGKAFNESGIYIGIRALISKGIALSGIIENYQNNWLKYRLSKPFNPGLDYSMQVDYNPDNQLNCYIRYRFSRSLENIIDEQKYLPNIISKEQHYLRFFVSATALPQLTLSSRIDLNSVKISHKEFGYLIYQDIKYDLKRAPIRIISRFAIFETESYNSRIYAYENDVLYSFSVPAYYGKGQKFYILCRWELYRRLVFWFKYSRTTFHDRNFIGTNADFIIGNKRSEVKIQVKFKL